MEISSCQTGHRKINNRTALSIDIPLNRFVGGRRNLLPRTSPELLLLRHSLLFLSFHTEVANADHVAGIVRAHTELI